MARDIDIEPCGCGGTRYGGVCGDAAHEAKILALVDISQMTDALTVLHEVVRRGSARHLMIAIENVNIQAGNAAKRFATAYSAIGGQPATRAEVMREMHAAGWYLPNVTASVAAEYGVALPSAAP